MNLLRRAGTDDVRRVLRDDNGQLAGWQIEHWDGRRSARIKAPPVHREVSLGDYGMNASDRVEFMVLICRKHGQRVPVTNIKGWAQGKGQHLLTPRNDIVIPRRVA